MQIPYIGALLNYAIFGLCVCTIFACLYALTTKKYLLIKSIHSASYLIFILFFLSFISLGFLLATGAFEYKFVYEATNIHMPFHQKISGLWANQSSSLNFWCFIMSIINLISIFIGRKYQDIKSQIFTALILVFSLCVFLVPVIFILNPFEKLWVSPSGFVESSIIIPENGMAFYPENGVGLNPSLRHIAMLIHPPFLYIGLIGFFIPYAHGMAALFSRSKKSDWVYQTKWWSLISWISLTSGMLLGSWWAYTILGWGGYWGWDPVEISGLIPWLLSIGFIHSNASIKKEVSNQIWNYVFICSIIVFTLLGIFIARSGVIESVHAYAKGPIGPILLVIITIYALFSLIMILTRWKSGNTKKNENSKRNLIEFSNILLLILVSFYFFGQTLPITSSLIIGERKTLNISTYQSFSYPFFILIIILSIFHYLNKNRLRSRQYRTLQAIIPTIISALCTIIFHTIHVVEFMQLLLLLPILFLISILLLDLLRIILTYFRTKRSKRKSLLLITQYSVGGVLIHLGFAILLLGILGIENWSSKENIILGVGESVRINEIEVVAQSSQSYRNAEGRVTFERTFLLIENGNFIKRMKPEIHFYENLNLQTIQPAISASLTKDVHFVMKTWENPKDLKSSINILFFPLASWVWIGGAIMIIGGMFLSYINYLLVVKKEITHQAIEPQTN